MEKNILDKKYEIISKTGYWEIPKNVVEKQIKKEKELDKALKTFMKLHKIAEILRKW